MVRSLPPTTTVPPKPVKMTLGDKLQRLAFLSPADLYALERIVDDLIERRMPPAPRRKERRVA